MSRRIGSYVEGPSPDHVKAFSDRNCDAVDDDRCQDEKVVDRNNDATGSTVSTRKVSTNSRSQTIARPVIRDDFEGYLRIKDGSYTCNDQRDIAR